MKIFPRYNPYLIAKYVKIWFTGQFYLQNVGLFCFEQGKIIKPYHGDKKRLAIITEVNQQVSRLATL